MASEWRGDKRNGIEIRRHEDGTIDEVCVYANGDCVVHSERMNDGMFAMGIFVGPHAANIQFHSKSGRAVIDCNGELE